MLNGDDNDDLLDGGLGDDTLNGGNNSDTADYSARANPVTVTIGGTGGEPGVSESDTINADVENAAGGSGGDTLNGETAPTS